MKKVHSFISVIIPVYNDPNGLSVTLKSLLNQSYPKDQYEIIVVDNNSTDGTPNIIRDYAKKNPQLIISLVEKNIQSSYAARNKGIKNSKGEIIAFIDADMYIKKNWLSQINKTFKNKKIQYLGCNVEIFMNNKKLTALYNKYTDFHINKFIKDDHFAPTCCLIVSKDLFQKFFLFNPNLISGGDVEFGNKVFEGGIKLYYSPTITMYHPARDSLKALILKQFRIGRGIFQRQKYFPEKKEIYKRNIFRVNHFLINLPKILSSSIKNWKKLSISFKITFCILYCFLTTSSYLGYLFEKYRKL